LKGVDILLKCNFCGKSPDEVKRTIARDVNTCICNECVILCMEILMDELGDIKIIEFQPDSEVESKD